MLNGPVAPSPAIPTYRPSRKISGSSFKYPNMPAVALTESKRYIRIPGLRKPRPRSAGASSRPMRSENIAELVRFFQTPEETEEEPRVSIQSSSSNMDIFKAGQRRLKHMAQTKPERITSSKSSDISSSSEKRTAQRQHLMALQREGLLPGLEELSNKPRPSRRKQAKEDVGSFLPSLEDLADKSRPSRTKEDVEAIGRPWLDDALASIPTDENRSTSQIELPLHGLRNESLSLGDLAALVEFSVSFPELYSHDSDPPPYQAQAQSQSQLQLQPQPRPQSQPQPESQPQVQASSVSGAATTNRDGRNGNQSTRHLENSAESHRNLRTERDNTTPNKPTQEHRGAVSIGRQHQNKPETDKNDDDSCCESNCDCDDAKSLAVLLRATQKLGGEKKRTSQNRSPGDTSSTVSANNAVSSTTTTSGNAITATASADSGKSNPAPHSLNQGVTDTPLFVRNLVENKHDGFEATKKINTKVPRGADQVLASPSQANFSPSSYLNAGPIPLKLVAECMPPVVSKPISSQPLNSSTQIPRSNVNGEMTLLQPPPTTIGPSSATLPRPRALLSPIPIQPRRARSVTPDVTSDSHNKEKKKSKKTPLYVITNAPLPPPARPLPSLPQSAGIDPGHKSVQGDRKPSTPAQPSSAPLEYRMEDRDSPVLGMNSHKLKLQRSLIGSRPSSHYSNRSIDVSDGVCNMSDGQSSRTASPAVSRPESRRGRSDQVRALRMRDIDAKKRREGSMLETNEPEKHSTKRGDSVHTQSDSQSHHERVKFSRRNRISAVPEFPLPKNPPINAQGTPNYRRRGSTTSLPGSISTMNGYEGGLSRSVSVTSGSIDSFSIRHGKVVHPSRDTTNNLHTNLPPESPLLPSSDDERILPRTRRSKPTGVMKEAGEFETRQGNHHFANGKSKQSTIKEKGPLNHAQYSSPSEISQYAQYSGDSQMNFVHLMRHLESRVVTLERQNKMLQAALLAALDVGVSHDADSAQSRSTSPALSSMRVPTISEMSMPSPNNLGIDGARQKQGKAAQRHHATRPVYTHEGISSGSRGSFETTSSHSDSSIRPADGIPSDRH